MNQRKKFHKNNKGSVLVLVLICFSFLGILGTLMLSVTAMNRKMRLIDAQAKDNFYSAEAVLDELCLGIEEISGDIISEAFAYMLQNYYKTPEGDRTDLFKQRFINLLFEKIAVMLAEDAVIPSGDSFIAANVMGLSALLLQEDLFNGNYRLLNNDGNPLTVIRNLDDCYILLKNLSVSFIDEFGYETSITTDLKLYSEYPDLSLSDTEVRGLYYNGYSVITDKLVKKTAAGPGAMVSGNVYAGSGIYVSDFNSHLSLKSDMVVTRGIIEAANKGNIRIETLTEGAENEIWASGLKTTNQAPSADDLEMDYINMTGDVYVMDDLNMNANKGNVVISGNYYGCRTTNMTLDFIGSPDRSSAISINAAHAVLDLSNVETLWLAGKNYLAVPNVYGNVSTGGGSNTPVLMGESLSYKGTQSAYLLPGDCIMGIGHNPMTATEYQQLLNGTAYIDIYQNFINGGLDLRNYLNIAKPYQAIVIQYLVENNDNEHMVYLYMNFRNPDRASDYMFDYAKENGDYMKNNLDMMGIGQIKLNTVSGSALFNSGTVLSYDENGMSFLNRRNMALEGEASYLGYNHASLKNFEVNALTQFYGLISKLDKDYLTSGAPAMPLSINLIKYSLVQENSRYSADGMAYKEETEGGNFVMICNGDVRFDRNMDNFDTGLIISGGKVTVSANRTFRGMIIAKGDIVLECGATIEGEPLAVKQLVEGNDEIGQYFTDYNIDLGMSTGSNTKYKAVTIVYENWRKN